MGKISEALCRIALAQEVANVIEREKLELARAAQQKLERQREELLQGRTS